MTEVLIFRHDYGVGWVGFGGLETTLWCGVHVKSVLLERKMPAKSPSVSVWKRRVIRMQKYSSSVVYTETTCGVIAR